MFVTHFLIGSIFGSFLQVVNLRCLTKTSLSFPPSHCDQCGHSLTPLDLIPLVSYVLLQAKCRYCHAKIPVVTWLSEVLGGLCLTAWHPAPLPTAYCLLAFLLLLISLRDITTHKIPAWWLMAAFIFALSIRLTITAPTWTTLLIVLCWAVLQLWPREFALIGLADLDLLCVATVLFPIVITAWLILMTSLSALLFCWVHRNPGVAFAPHFLVGYLVVVFTQLATPF